jgi:hypothetical protein
MSASDPEKASGSRHRVHQMINHKNTQDWEERLARKEAPVCGAARPF